MRLRFLKGADRLAIFLAAVVVAGCGDESGPNGPSPPACSIENAGEWSLKWGQQERTFSYGYAFATINPNGSISIMFLNEDLSPYPLAGAGVENIQGVPLNMFVDCSLVIAFDSLLAETAVSPLDPLQTQVAFSKKELVAGGTLSGEIQGDLATCGYPDLEKVTILKVTFENVCIGGGP